MELVREVSIQKITPERSLTLAQNIVSVYRDVWITTYVSEELNITKDDLAAKFADFDEVLQEWKANILGDVQRGYWIVKDEKEYVVGFGIARLGVTENELEYIYLKADVQGHGVGDQLMNEMLTFMGTSKPIVLYGAAYNKRAIRFYKKYGFELSSESVPPKPLPNGKELPSMKMVRYS